MATSPKATANAPLCDAIRAEDWGTVEELLASAPVRHTREVDKSGATPLHWAACVGKADLVTRLIALHPAAAEKQDKFNKRLPLHYATFFYAREALRPGATYARAESIEELARIFPQGSRTEDTQGKIPLQYALDKQAPPESLQVLERVTYPDRLPILDEYYTWKQLLKWTKDPQTFEKMLDHVDVYLLNPLQHAVSKDAPVALVHAIISARPELLHSFDSRRRSLVHLAATANADAETMELLLKHLPAAVATVDLNRKLPVQYLLDHPDADTVGAQENIFALLRVHPAVLWQPVVRQQLLTVADAAEIADVVKTALRNEISALRLAILQSSKSNQRKKQRRKLKRKVSSEGGKPINNANSANSASQVDQGWVAHGKRLWIPWKSAAVAYHQGHQEQGLAADASTAPVFLPYYVLVQPLHRHFELCTEHLLHAANYDDEMKRQVGTSFESHKSLIVQQRLNERSLKLMHQMRRLSLRTADHARRPITAALQQRVESVSPGHSSAQKVDADTTRSTLVQQESKHDVQNRWSKAYVEAFVLPTVEIYRELVERQVKEVHESAPLAHLLSQVCRHFHDHFGHMFRAGIVDMCSEKASFVALVEKAIGMAAVVKHQLERGSVADTASKVTTNISPILRLVDIYSAAADGRCTLALEHLLETINQNGDCFQLYQLDGDDTSELETSTKMEGPDLPLDLHSFAPGLACQLPLRAGVKDEADMDTVLARYEAEIDGSALPTDHSDACAGLPQPTSFLKPFGAAVEKQLLREKTVSTTTANESSFVTSDDVLRAFVVCRNCEQMASLLSALESCEGETFGLPSPAEPKSLLSSLDMVQPTIQSGVAHANSGIFVKDSFTVQLIGIDSSRLLTPSDGDWVDIVVNVRITVRSPDVGPQHVVTQATFVAEIRIAHARLLVSPTGVRNSRQHFCDYWVQYRAFRCAQNLLRSGGLAAPATLPSTLFEASPSPNEQDTDSITVSNVAKQRGRERLGQARKIDEMLTHLQSARIADAQRIEELEQELAARDAAMEELKEELRSKDTQLTKQRHDLEAQAEAQLQKFALLASEKIVAAGGDSTEMSKSTSEHRSATVEAGSSFQATAKNIIDRSQLAL